MLRYARNVQGREEGGNYKRAFPFETDGGMNWDEVFCWTVTLPEGTLPAPRDGEVKSFERMTPEALVESLRSEPDAWKTNSGLMLLQVLAEDLRTRPMFTDEERLELQALSVPDPRPPESRGELRNGSMPPKKTGPKPL